MTINIKLAIAAGVLAIGIAMGGAGAWKIQGIRIDRMSVDAERMQKENRACVAANSENTATIAKLQSEVKKAGVLCSSRLKAKDSFVSRLQSIDAIAPPQYSKSAPEKSGEFPEVKNEKAEGDNRLAVDPLLDELNRMFPGKTGRPN